VRAPADGGSDVGADRLGTAGDDVYARLVEAHDGLTEEESHALNARLVLVLMNAVGDEAAIARAIELATRGRDRDG